MGKNLMKEGKRRCYGCSVVLELNDSNFYKSKYNAGGFRGQCKSCSIKEMTKRMKERRLKGREFCETCKQIIRIKKS